MLRRLVLLGLAVATATVATAQDGETRAWQRRLELEVPVPVPVVEIAPTNPFSVVVDTTPILRPTTPPEDVDVRGRAVIAAYVDASGECRGAVPLEIPYPGLAAVLVQEVTSARFDAGRSGNQEVAAWTVLEVGFEGRVKKGQVTDQTLEMPDPSSPPRPAVQEVMAPPGNLGGLPYTPTSELTTRPRPRRIRARLPSRDLETRIRTLVHVTAEGRVDRFVPLDVEPGLEPWLAAFLGAWNIEPGQRDGEPVDAWVVYSCRAVLDMSSLQSTESRVVTDREFEPPAPANP
jgi:hypothetical protein